jgi:hypothetical protein
MGFKPGDPRPENAGRKKGTPNKRTQQLHEIAKDLDADPFMFLVHVLKGDAKSLGIADQNLVEEMDYDEQGNEIPLPTPQFTPVIKFETRMEAAKELMPYLYGKRKPVDSNGDDSNDIFSALLNAVDPNK